MRDIPIIFSAPMVRALLADRKSMTRRLAWGKTRPHTGTINGAKTTVANGTVWQRVQPGDRLWVRESLQSFQREPRATAQYVADITAVQHRGVVDGWCDGRAYWQWDRKSLPSIHMPRWASRLTLIVTSTKIERVQSISNRDAIVEGVEWFRASWSAKDAGEAFLRGTEAAHETKQGSTAQRLFYLLWIKLHGEQSWKENPEVVALTFTVHKQNIDELPKAEAA